MSTNNGDMFDGSKRKRKKGQQQQSNLDPAIAPPYTQKWPEITKQHQKMILDEVGSVLQEKMTDQWLIQKKTKLLKKKSADDAKSVLKEVIAKHTERYNGHDVHKLISSLDDPGKMKDLNEFKLYTAMGVNDIGSCFERGVGFSLILCCGSADEWLCQGLLCQSLMAGVPLCRIQGLTDILSHHLNVRCVAAVGFKKKEDGSSPFGDLVDFIVDKIPDVKSAWTEMWKPHLSEENGSLAISGEKLSGEYQEMNIHWKQVKKHKRQNDRVLKKKKIEA